MTPEERAIEALFKHRDFPIADNAKGERDCYAISIPTLIRTIQAAENDAIERAAKVIEEQQETISETAQGTTRHVTARRAGNMAGIAYADAIRALVKG